jgi:hypothetical protein
MKPLMVKTSVRFKYCGALVSILLKALSGVQQDWRTEVKDEL